MNTLQIINPETQIIPEVNFEYFSDFAQYRLKQMERGQILTEKGVMYSAATRRIYKSAITLFKEFELLLQSRIKIHEMNGRTVKAFERFLISKGLTLNSVGAYISKIKAVGNFLFAEDIGLKPVKHSVKSEQTTKIYLSIPEIRQLKNNETLTEGQKKVLDVFLVQAFTGFSYKTLQEFLKNPLAFMKDFDGKTYIEIERSKTGETSVVPLHNEVQRIITKYNGAMPEFTEVYVNRTLKIIGRKAGLNNPIPVKITKGGEKVTQMTEKFNLLTSHAARRTMISLGFQNGLSTTSLQAISGHTTEKQLNAYNRSEKIMRIKDILGHQFFKEEI